jgi:hypothetical protein
MYNIKNKMGKVTLVTPPSMIKPNGVSLTIVNLDEGQKQTLTSKLDEHFPSNDVTIFVWDKPTSDDEWLGEANQNSDYVIEGSQDIIKQIETIKEAYDRRKFDL